MSESSMSLENSIVPDEYLVKRSPNKTVKRTLELIEDGVLVNYCTASPRSQEWQDYQIQRLLAMKKLKIKSMEYEQKAQSDVREFPEKVVDAPYSSNQKEVVADFPTEESLAIPITPAVHPTILKKKAKPAPKIQQAKDNTNVRWKEPIADTRLMPTALMKIPAQEKPNLVKSATSNKGSTSTTYVNKQITAKSVTSPAKKSAAKINQSRIITNVVKKQKINSQKRISAKNSTTKGLPLPSSTTVPVGDTSISGNSNIGRRVPFKESLITSASKNAAIKSNEATQSKVVLSSPLINVDVPVISHKIDQNPLLKEPNVENINNNQTHSVSFSSTETDRNALLGVRDVNQKGFHRMTNFQAGETNGVDKGSQTRVETKPKFAQLETNDKLKTITSTVDIAAYTMPPVDPETASENNEIMEVPNENGTNYCARPSMESINGDISNTWRHTSRDIPRPAANPTQVSSRRNNTTLEYEALETLIDRIKPPVLPDLQVCNVLPGSQEWEKYWLGFNKKISEYYQSVAKYSKQMDDLLVDEDGEPLIDEYKRRHMDEQATKLSMELTIPRPPLIRQPLRDVCDINGYVIRALGGGGVRGAYVTTFNHTSFRLEIHVDKLDNELLDNIIIDTKFNTMTITLPDEGKGHSYRKLIQISAPKYKNVQNLEIGNPLYNGGKIVITGK